MKRFFALVFALLCCLALHAVPAIRGYHPYTQPDGSVVRLMAVGDEFGHILLTEAGEQVEIDSEGWVRFVPAGRAGMRRSAVRSRRAASRQLRSSRAPARGIASGKKHFLVVLVEFSDKVFTVERPNQAFDNMLNKPGYSENGGTGSARDYYFDNSKGLFEPVFDVYGPVKLDNGFAYYGANDSEGNDLRAEQAVIDACKALDGKVDFSDYDLDGDGYVDMVFMYYAWYGEADSYKSNTIWPHQWYIEGGKGKEVILDGVKLDSYACTNELNYPSGTMCGIGTACHEFGHAMGLPDFYDVDYNKNGTASTLMDYSVMCSGNYNNSGRTPPYFNMVERILLGWKQWSDIREFPKTGNYTIPAVHDELVYRTPTDMEGEYFLYECRNKSGWDAYLPGQGLLVYHLDRSSREISIYSDEGYVGVPAAELWDNWGEYNSINENGSHPCFYLVPSPDQKNLNYKYSDLVPFPGSGSSQVTTFTPESWNGIPSLICFSDISYDSEKVSLNVKVPLDDLDYNIIDNPGGGQYKAGERFTFALVESESRPVSSVQWYYDDEPVSSASVSLTAGKHTIEAQLTLKSGVRKTVSLEISVN